MQSISIVENTYFHCLLFCSILKDLLFLFMYINICLYVCLCTIYLSGVSSAEAERGLETNLRPLEEHQRLLTTEPPLQLYIYLL